MTNKEAIQEQFALIGQMSSEGAALFAADNQIDPNAEADTETVSAISHLIDEFVEKYAMRSQSVSENGISLSFSEKQNRNFFLLKLRKYGITVSEEVGNMLGINVIRDITNRW